MSKNIRFFMRILGFGLVFGLAAALTSCEDHRQAEIRVTNSSPHPADEVVRVRVFMSGRSDAVASQDIPRGQSVSFSLDAGEYQVTVRDFSFPQGGGVINMSGDVRLNFNGNSVTRTN
jgi:hypothetical protein